MAFESSIIVGSGIAPLKKLLPPNPGTQEKHLRGTNVVVLNPEDGSAGGSGVNTAMSVGAVAVKIPTTPMKYRRALSIFNNNVIGTLYIGFSNTVTIANGFPIGAQSSIPLTFSAAVEIWGIGDTTIDVRILEVS